MPLYPTLEDLLVDQYKESENTTSHEHQLLLLPSQIGASMQPSAPIYEPNTSNC
ncbi:unnamed protein product [Thelazia callipaeda]|uniref:Uncharacterized protein n=1 Tax=Thelazia callipaeda TaxID=103827 RepID=A0A0N5CRV3_THECL|nr:unnamed protein product [Thelazia callipaeda]